MENFKIKMSDYASKHIPFIFVIDFEMQKPFISRLSHAADEGIFFNVHGQTNAGVAHPSDKIVLHASPIARELYQERFNSVQREIGLGNTYLLNLTFPTEISVNGSLKEIFLQSQAPYKLLFKNEFVVFSPECFVEIFDNEIFTYPMKGTIDARQANAREVLLSNKKEEWEHNTIVDLMRNDLAMVAEDIEVVKYRYIDKIKTNKGEILQTSSKIKGTLSSAWRENLGEIICRLLPAGSVSGAPKQKTLEIIRKNELSARGYYSGIFGIYDGVSLDSAVLIRYIEKLEGKLFFKSGGGITSRSNLDEEYNELLQKVYIPFI